MLQKETLLFFEDLKQNNKRIWFEENKPRYLSAQEDYLTFIEKLLVEVRKIEPINEKELKKYINRIYRDNRFSKEKIPYNTHIVTTIERAPEYKKSPVYLFFEPGNTFIAGGIRLATPELLKKIRQEIDFNGAELEKILSKKAFSEMFGEIYGDALVKAPNGYSPDHPQIELIKKKEFIAKRDFDDDMVCSKHFIKELTASYKVMLPFLNFLDVIIAD